MQQIATETAYKDEERGLQNPDEWAGKCQETAKQLI